MDIGGIVLKNMQILRNDVAKTWADTGLSKHEHTDGN